MNYADIKEKLKEPVPKELISTRPAGGNSGAQIEYINITDYKDLLDARAGIWESRVNDFKQIGESLCCVVNIAIHCDDGIFNQDGTGIEPLATDSYGDPFSNAYAQAFRRACEGHGLSRELWRKDDHPQGANQAGRSTPYAGSNGGYSSQSVDQLTNPIARSLSDLVTVKQLGMMRAIARELGLDADQECVSVLKCRPDELSKRAASAFIEHLKAMQGANGQPSPSASQPVPHANGHGTKPQYGKGGAGEMATGAQLALLKKKAGDAGLDAIEFAQQEFPDVESSADLSRAAVSWLIDQF